MARHALRLKRAYEEPASSDGKRVLVERLWPRGLSKQRAKLDLWLKEIAPSAELRQWFAHDPAKWPEFKKRYLNELKHSAGPVGELKELSREQEVTLVYAARDQEHNSAQVLKSFLEGKAT